jgi:hypothetical protein
MSAWPRARFATEADRFFHHVQKTDGCWLWSGYRNDVGYGYAWWRKSNRLAHRVAWEIATGVWPPSTTHVCHSCDNPSCVRPDHLFLGTALDNIRDMIAKGRKVVHNRGITHCKRGHEFTAANTYVEGASRSRRCRACVRLRVGPLKGKRLSHCRRGHELTSANTRVEKGGVRRCAVCRAAYNASRSTGVSA